MAMENSIKDLQHAGIEAMIKVMAADISVNFAEVEANFKVLRAKGDAESYVRGTQYENILKEQKITNGRVKDLEKDTDIIRFFKKYTWVMSLCAVGFWALYNFMDYDKLIRMLKFVF